MEKLNMNQFLDESGRITQLSENSQKRHALLAYLAEKFELDRNYSEREVNEICSQWHTFGDYFLLRRELIDDGLLSREQDGSRYWKTKTELSLAEARSQK